MDDGPTWEEECCFSEDGPPPSAAVVEAVASAEGIDSTELPPLYRAVDPEGLDRLFGEGTAGRIEFTYSGYEVTVLAAGRVVVRSGEPDEP